MSKMHDLEPEESIVLVAFPVSKKVLSETSKLFIEHFCYLSKNPVHNRLEDISPASYLEFLTYILNNEGSNQSDYINWEVVKLAEKYQNQDILDDMMKKAEDIVITEDNVIEIAVKAMNNEELKFCAAVPEKMLNRCVVALHDQDINVWENYREEDDYEKAANYLSVELSKLKKKLKVSDLTEVSRTEGDFFRKKSCREFGIAPRQPDAGRNSESSEEEDHSEEEERSEEGTKEDEIDPSQLGESVIYARYPVSKQLLALTSPVFRRQFCGSLRSKSSSTFEHLEVDYMSPEAYQAFFAFIKEDKHLFAVQIQKCHILMETCLLADKYQVDDLTKKLEKAVDDFAIDKKNFVCSVVDTMKYKDLNPCAQLCKKLLQKLCVAVFVEKLDILELFALEGKNADALLWFKLELMEF